MAWKRQLESKKKLPEFQTLSSRNSCVLEENGVSFSRQMLSNQTAREGAGAPAMSG